MRLVSASLSKTYALLLIVVVTAVAQARPAPEAVSFPENPRFTSQRFGEQFGIGVVTATSMAQDHDGFLWIGTQTGLFRFDGSRVTRMAAVEPLVGHYIDLVIAGPDDSLWIEGIRGIARFKDGRFLPFNIPDTAGKLTNSAQGLALDRHGNIFALAERGIVRGNPDIPNNLRLFGANDGIACKTQALVSGRDGSIWFACDQKIGHIPSTGDRVEWEPDVAVPDERVIALLFDGRENLWVRTSRHMARVDRVHHMLVDEPVAPANEEGGKPSLDQDGDLLVPTVAGLFWHDGGRWRVISEKDGLSSNVIQVALEDSEGTLWVAGWGTGLDHLTGIRDWSAWTKDEGLPDNATWATQRDRQGKLWVSTPHGIAIWNAHAHSWKTLTSRDGLAATETRQLELARDGSIWAVAVPGGITRINATTLATQKYPSFHGQNFLFILADPNGDIWATTRKQLVRFKGNDPNPAPEQVPLPADVGNEIWYLDFSPSGILWGTGRSQIMRFDGKSWREFSRKDGLLGNTVTSLAAVSDNEVWLGYDDVVGITRLTLDSHGHPQLQQHDWDYNIIGKDSQHRVWFNSINGVSVVTPQGDTFHFSRAEGLIWDDLSPYGFREEPDGSFLIATSRGLARYVPRSSAPVATSPDVLITAATLGEQTFRPDSHPRVNYKQGSFHAEFTPLLLNNGSDVTCRYRLQGLDSSSVESGAREVLYSHLPAGSYTFNVQCRKDLLPWSPHAASFSFTILPRWWETAWFKGLAGIGCLILVWIIVRARTARLNRRRQELEQAVAERNAELLQKNRELEEISLTDPLTHARNRRYFYEMIPADAAHVLRYYRGVPEKDKPEPAIKELIFAMVDIDFFKFANDEHGHIAGDRLIHDIAARLSNLIRKSDVLVRWGGEEFLVVCRSTDRLNAPLLCSRILETISARPYQLENASEVTLTCSVGWAPFPWIPEAPDALTLEQVIEIADRALYIAKRTGRNHGVGLVPSQEAVRSPYDIRTEALRTASPDMADIIRTDNPCIHIPKSRAASASSEQHS